ncbi:unnamed protein product [Peniophora sp. CBMAI 1063]|nr:unnamed protein product [Peniophora sp. CBMAI 1063]
MDDVVNALGRFLRTDAYVRRMQARAAQQTSCVVGVEGQDAEDDDDDDGRMPPPLESIPDAYLGCTRRSPTSPAGAGDIRLNMPGHHDVRDKSGRFAKKDTESERPRRPGRPKKSVRFESPLDSFRQKKAQMDARSRQRTAQAKRRKERRGHVASRSPSSEPESSLHRSPPNSRRTTTSQIGSVARTNLTSSARASNVASSSSGTTNATRQHTLSGRDSVLPPSTSIQTPPGSVSPPPEAVNDFEMIDLTLGEEDEEDVKPLINDVDRLLVEHGVDGDADLVNKTDTLLSLRQKAINAHVSEEDLPDVLKLASIKRLLNATVGRIVV